MIGNIVCKTQLIIPNSEKEKKVIILRPINLIGNKYGKLIVLELDKSAKQQNRNGYVRWIVEI